MSTMVSEHGRERADRVPRVRGDLDLAHLIDEQVPSGVSGRIERQAIFCPDNSSF
jgi:hypothetical protein